MMIIKACFDRLFAGIFSLLCAFAVNWPFWMVPRADALKMAQSAIIVANIIIFIMIVIHCIPALNFIYRFIEGPCACLERRPAFARTQSGYQGYYLLYATAAMLLSITLFSVLSILVKSYI